MALDDGFNSPSLDTSHWSANYPSGNGGEKQYYSPDALKIDGGILTINASPIPSHGYQYTSGIIQSRGKFAQKYGQFEIRAKLPRGQGFWPAFWLLPDKPNFPVEIDVFEMHGDDPHTIFMSLHWKGPDGSHQHVTVPYTSPADLTADFHTYTLNWTPDRLTWLLDGKQIYSTQEHIPDEPMFILVNMAVGGRWPGNPDSTTQFPGVMQIQYVHASKMACSSGILQFFRK